MVRFKLSTTLTSHIFLHELMIYVYMFFDYLKDTQLQAVLSQCS